MDQDGASFLPFRDEMFLISSSKTERRYGQRLKHIVEIPSSGDGELEAFIR